jgi:hypothetical protein
VELVAVGVVYDSDVAEEDISVVAIDEVALPLATLVEVEP